MQSTRRERYRQSFIVLIAFIVSLACQLTGGAPSTLLPLPSPTAPTAFRITKTSINPFGLSPSSTPSRDRTDTPAPADLYPCLPKSEPEIARVSEVIDGDTIHVIIQGTEFKLRYIGINAPENTIEKEPFGQEAEKLNRQLVSNNIVTLVKDVSETDRFGRLLRYVLIGEMFVNLELVQEGYARAKSYPPDTSCDQVLAQAEREARIAGKGLWALPTVTAVPPTPTLTGASSVNCDPAYPNVCIPSPPPDLDCKDIPYRKFKVFAPDPHHFDMDGNGFGCEEP